MSAEVLLLWTVMYGGQPTVLQYPTEFGCRAAVDAGLPYLDVPAPLSCALRPDHVPHETCGDGSVAYGWHCRPCMRQGELVTSSLCEAHGYKGVR